MSLPWYLALWMWFFCIASCSSLIRPDSVVRKLWTDHFINEDLLVTSAFFFGLMELLPKYGEVVSYQFCRGMLKAEYLFADGQSSSVEGFGLLIVAFPETDCCVRHLQIRVVSMSLLHQPTQQNGQDPFGLLFVQFFSLTLEHDNASYKKRVIW